MFGEEVLIPPSGARSPDGGRQLFGPPDADEGSGLSFEFRENEMLAADLKNMDVDALLTLRADVEKMLVEGAAIYTNSPIE